MIKNRGKIIQEIQSKYFKQDRLNIFKIGDTVKVYYKIMRGTKEQIQTFEGAVIAIKGEGLHKMFNVRKISWNVGVERIFPLHSPKIDKIEVVSKGRIRRSKLYYLKNRFGKSSQIKKLNTFIGKSAQIKKLNTLIDK